MKQIDFLRDCTSEGVEANTHKKNDSVFTFASGELVLPNFVTKFNTLKEIWSFWQFYEVIIQKKQKRMLPLSGSQDNLIIRR